MGQTLTHGIYLPDEGERNCYNGLAGNWSILDGAVGTVAEHTSQIAGKAPAVHTHTKADITDFPAYGTTAGTICEGNDSRLSDARTPVAHTHGKADITDLFNYANTWTSLNTYNGMVLLKSSSDVAEQFKQKLPKDVSVSTDALVRFNTLVDSEDHNVVVEALGHWASYVSKSTTLKYKNDSTKQGIIDFRLESSGSGLFYPQSPFECNLGNSGNQWKSVYAQTYYYNGVAWGLDKANTWSQINDFKTLRLYGVASNNLVMYPPSGEKGDSSTFGFNIICSDKNLGNYAASGVANIGMGQSGGMSYVAMNASTKGSIDNNIHSIQIGLQITASDNANIGSFYPTQNGGINLGTSTNKWKSLNGINPGALSFPEGTTGNANTTFNPDLTDWLTDGTGFTITAQVTGWLHIRIQNSTGNFAWVKRASAGSNQTWGIVGNSDTNSDIADIPLNVPVVQGYVYTLKLKTSRLSAAIFMCLGNV